MASAAARQTPLICSGHSRPVPDLHYSPVTPDGFFIISACLDGKPMLRNGETGDWIGTFEGHKGAVWAVRLNTTATMTATGSADYTAKVWNALSGAELISFAHTRIVKSVDFSNDDRQLVTGGQDKMVRVFDLERPDAAPVVLEAHQAALKATLFSRITPHLIYSAGQDEVIRIWDLRARAQVGALMAKAPVASMDLVRQGTILVTAAGREVCFWDAQTFVPLKVSSVPLDLHSAALHPTLPRFVAGGADFYAHVFDYTTGEEQEVHKGHHGPVHCIRYAPDGESFASGSEDGTIRIWQNQVKSYGLWQQQQPPAAAN